MLSKVVSAFLFVVLAFAVPARSQLVNEVESKNTPSTNRNRGQDMLDQIQAAVKKYYYDKNYRGIDLEARFKKASEDIKKLETNSEIFRVIAQVLLEFKDSHTRFFPPGRTNQVEYGFTMQMIGSECYVTSVKKGSDAEAKGLKAGDLIAGIGKYNINRNNFKVIRYFIYQLDPQARLRLFIRNPDKTEKELMINSSVKTLDERNAEAKKRKEKPEEPYKCKEVSGETIACKLTTFVVEKPTIDKMMKEVAGHKKFILDLRGNGGGYVRIEEYLVGHFFDHDVKMATFITRDKSKERIAKPQKERAFTGDFLVLLDSNSASASEVFGRVMQLENRGKVVGDVSSGAVMTSWSIPMANFRGAFTYSVFGLNLTVADLIMRDGNRLEDIGVIPDHPFGPTPEALAEKTDPILAYAAKLFGEKLSEKEAGAYYFLTKKSEDDSEENNDASGEDDN
jgi:carboxyl-terminal processing protease